VDNLRPDVVLMDIGMPGMSSFEAARVIRRDAPQTRLIFLTMYEDEEYLLQCLDVGAAGYVLKDAPTDRMIQAVREVQLGRKYISPRVAEKLVKGSAFSKPDAAGRPARTSSLTPREREVVKMIAEGKSVKEVASLLGLSVKTIEAHKFNLMRKLDIHNK